MRKALGFEASGMMFKAILLEQLACKWIFWTVQLEGGFFGPVTVLLTHPRSIPY